jgi:hypothetical protein
MLGDITIASELYIVCGYTDMRKSIDAAKPVIEKASKDVGEFIEEVKEEVKASEK